MNIQSDVSHGNPPTTIKCRPHGVCGRGLLIASLSLNPLDSASAVVDPAKVDDFGDLRLPPEDALPLLASRSSAASTTNEGSHSHGQCCRATSVVRRQFVRPS